MTLDLPFPVYSVWKEICRSTGRSTSQALSRGLSRSPPAAPAAGGRGNPVSRLVYSVGELGFPTGDDGVVFCRIGVCGWWLSTPTAALQGVSSSSCCPRRARAFAEVRWAFSPSWRPGDGGAGGLLFRWKKVLRFGSMAMESSGVGPAGPVIGDFPFAWGRPPFQGVLGGRCDGAPPTAPWIAMAISLQMDGSVILCSLGGLSVMFPN
jgi:hypothetical protein